MDKTQRLRLNDHLLEFAWHGPSAREAPTLVFLHEGLGCVAMWHDFPARMAAATGYGALVYSRLGYGKSDPCDLPRPVDFMHQEALVVLPALLEALGVRDTVLIGHSDGGSIALIYAGGTSAEPLRAVVTLAAHVFCEQLSVDSIARAAVRYRLGDLREKLQKYHGKNTDCAFWGWNGVWLNPQFRRWNIESYLPAISVPTLVIQGDDDEYGTKGQVEAISEGIADRVEVLMLPDCGHSPHRDQEDAVVEAVCGFVRRVDR